MPVIRPKDRVTLLADLSDGTLIPERMSGVVTDVFVEPTTCLRVRWENGKVATLVPGPNVAVRSMFVPCPNSACGTEDPMDLGQDPASGEVECSACGCLFHPDDFR